MREASQSYSSDKSCPSKTNKVLFLSGPGLGKQDSGVFVVFAVFHRRAVFKSVAEFQWARDPSV